MLGYLVLFLGAAVLFVPIFKRAGLGAVLGYLAAGIVIGPGGFGLIKDVEAILHLSEFGVVLLLFVIGLELQPSRLWRLRHAVFLMGGAQVLLSAALLGAAATALGLPAAAAVVAGFGLAMSSTALVLQMLGERRELTDRHGRAAFAILLFQDLSVIPFLALVPLMAAQATTQGATQAGQATWIDVAKVVAVIAIVIAGGRYALRPILRRLAATEIPEVFTAAALLLVAGTALAMEAVGLTASLGAFLAGVLLADSEYRHELQADIEPFKGLLLGLFFIAVGMAADIGVLTQQPLLVAALVLGLMAIKAAVLFAVALGARQPIDSARRLAFAGSQGGEFGFVLFGVAAAAGILTADVERLLVVVVTVSMILTPPLYALQARWRRAEEVPLYDEIVVPETPVVIAGFGPFGQIIGRILRLRRIAFTVLEKNWQQVDFVRQFGSPVFYSDASRLEVLRAAHVGSAKLMVIAIAEPEASLKIAETVRRHFPTVRIMAVARTRQHWLHLSELGVGKVIRRSYFSSLEMSREVLIALGDSTDAAERSIATFRRFDQQTLLRQQAFFRDEKQLLQSAREAAQELEQLFEADTAAQAESAQETQREAL